MVTIYAVLSLIATAVGLACVLVGLYRRDPRMQGKVAGALARGGGWRRRLLRRRSPHADVKVTGGGSQGMSAEAAHVPERPGPPPDRDAPVEERLGWVERAVDTAFRELDDEARHRDQDVGDLVARVADLRAVLESDVGTMRRRRDEAGAPKRLEWWGVAFVLVGLILAGVDAAIALL